jgi:hypothetical protein
MARRNAQVYSKDPGIKAIMVVGSVGMGRASDYSDIDTVLIYEKLPSRKVLEEAMRLNRGKSWQVLSEDEEGFLDTYRVKGVECQFAHGLVGWYENLLKQVLENYSTDRVYHLVMSGIQDALPLYGKKFVDDMKTRISDYPKGLSIALVNEHLKFPPIDELRYRTMKEDNKLRYYDVLTKVTTAIMGVLIGLNRMYMPRNFEKMKSLVDRFDVKPESVYERLNSLFTQKKEAALAELDKLILELAQIIENRLPEVDVDAFRKSYLTKLKPIAIDEGF